LALALLTIPLMVYYSSKIAHNWIIDGILAQKWAFEKGLISLVSLFAISVAALRSVWGFEKKKEQLFAADAGRRTVAKKGKPASKGKAAPKGKAAIPAKEAPKALPGAQAKPAAKTADKAAKKK